MNRPEIIAAGAAVCGAAAILFFFDPSQHAWYPPCLIRTYTGRPCPGCGTARALHALLHGRAADASGLNPFLFAAAPLAVLQLLALALRRGRGSDLHSTGRRPGWRL